MKISELLREALDSNQDNYPSTPKLLPYKFAVVTSRPKMYDANKKFKVDFALQVDNQTGMGYYDNLVEAAEKLFGADNLIFASDSLHGLLGSKTDDRTYILASSELKNDFASVSIRKLFKSQGEAEKFAEDSRDEFDERRGIKTFIIPISYEPKMSLDEFLYHVKGTKPKLAKVPKAKPKEIYSEGDKVVLKPEGENPLEVGTVIGVQTRSKPDNYVYTVELDLKYIEDDNDDGMREVSADEIIGLVS
jgi:hypothetical protein